MSKEFNFPKKQGGPQPPQARINVDPRDLEDVTCEKCGNFTFQAVILLKHVPAVVSPEGKPGFMPKDVCLVEDKLYVLYNTHGGQYGKVKETISGVIIRYAFPSMKEEKSVTIENAHLDCICYNGNFYITDQYNDMVRIYSKELIAVGSLTEDLDMPHGCDVFEDMLAVTNYGTNTVKIFKL